MAYIKDFKSDDFLCTSTHLSSLTTLLITMLDATVDIAIWSDTEQGLAITAGSLATLRPLFRIISDKLGMSTHATSAHRKTPSYGNRLSSRDQERSRRKRRSPFSMQTDALDEEYRLGNIKPLPLSDTFNDDKDGWQVQVAGDNESEEELHTKKEELRPPSMRFGGLRDFPGSRPSSSVA